MSHHAYLPLYLRCDTSCYNLSWSHTLFYRRLLWVAFFLLALQKGREQTAAPVPRTYPNTYHVHMFSKWHAHLSVQPTIHPPNVHMAILLILDWCARASVSTPTQCIHPSLRFRLNNESKVQCRNLIKKPLVLHPQNGRIPMENPMQNIRCLNQVATLPVITISRPYGCLPMPRPS